MATLTVGTNRQFKSVASAVAAAVDGDRIAIDAGVYTNDWPGVVRVSIAFSAVGGRVTMNSNALIPNGKAILICGGATGYPTISIDGIDFTGAKVADANGAGVRYQNGDLTITNCSFKNCEDGILATPFVKGTGTVSIDRTEFDSCGAGDGQSHNIYIGYLLRFTLTNSLSHRARVGHLVKSRAQNTTVANCRLYDEDSTSSYAIDIPNAGNTTISNCTIQQGKSGQNPFLMTWGVGGASNTGRNILITSCTIVNDATTVRLMYNAVTDTAVPFTDCSFFGVPQTVQSLGKGRVTLNNPTWLATRPDIPTGLPYADAAHEFLTSDARIDDEPLPHAEDPDADPEPDDEETGVGGK